MRSFCASALLAALLAPSLAIPEIRQGGTQGWELRSVSLSELSKLGLAAGPSDRRPIFQSIHGGPPQGGPNFQQVQILGAAPGPRGPRSFHGANIPLENLFARAQIHRGPPGPPVTAQINQGPRIHGGPALGNLRLPPGWQAIQIDANQFKSIASGKPIDIPGLGNGPVHISSQFAQNLGAPSASRSTGAVSELPNNKLEIPQHSQTFQHGPFRFAHVSEEVQLIGQNGQKTIEVPVGTGHDQIKQVVQQQAEPQSSPVPAAEGGINIPGGLPAAIQQFLKDNTPQFQLQDEEEQKQAEQPVQNAPQHQHQHQQEQQQHQQAPPQHLQQAQHVQQEQHHHPDRVHFPQQPIHHQHVQQQAPQPIVQVQPAESPISNIPPGWKVIRVTAEQLAAYQRGGPAPWLSQQQHQDHQQQQQQQQQHHHHRLHQQSAQQQEQPQEISAPPHIVQHIPQQHQEQNRQHFHQTQSEAPHGFQGQAESYQGPSAQAPPVRLPPRANVKVVYLPYTSVKNAQHQQPLYREERQEAPRHQAPQDWQPPNMEHGHWKAITSNFATPQNGHWKQQPESSNGGPAYATSERYHQRGNHIEEHRHEHPPSGQHHQQQQQHHENQRARGVVTRENAGKWY